MESEIKENEGKMVMALLTKKGKAVEYNRVQSDKNKGYNNG